MQSVFELAARHGAYLGNVIRPKPDDDGITLLVVWGAPTSHERDLERAMRFVDELRRAIGVHEVRVGATYGTVYAGYVGADAQQTYTVVGAGVNLAARLCVAGEWGQVRVDGSIAARLPSGWQAPELGPVSYKGFDGPVPSHLVVAATDRTSSAPPTGPFVGRQPEIQSLEHALGPLLDGRPAGIVGVIGEAGIGKSRLIAETRARSAERADGPRWLTVDVADAHLRPFGVLTGVMSRLVGARGPDELPERLAAFVRSLEGPAPDAGGSLERARVAIGDLLGVPDDVAAASVLDPESRFDNIVHAVEEILGAVARSGPVVVAISSDQLDPSTVDVVERVRTAFTDVPIALVVESRTPDVGLAVDHVVDIDGLSTAEVTELACEVLGGEPAPSLQALLVARTSGNPYFVAELLGFLGREQLVRPGSDGIEAEELSSHVPLDLSHALVSRLDALPAGVRAALQTASVLGREFDGDVLDDMLAGRAGPRSELAAAVTAGALEVVSGTRYRFRHSLLCDAAYGMQLHGDLRQLHRSAATSILRVHTDHEAHAGALAVHCDRGGQPADAIGWYVVAGDRAAARFANSEALAHLDRALELARGRAVEVVPAAGVDPFSILRRAADVYDRVADRGAQGRVLDEMDELAGDDGFRQTEILLRRGELAEVQSRFGDADRFVRRGLAILDSLSDTPVTVERRADLLVVGMSAARAQGNQDLGVELAHEARACYERIGSAMGVARIEDALGSIAWDAGDFAAAAASHRTAAEAAATAGDVVDETMYLNNLGTALFGAGDYWAARLIHEQGVERSRAIGYRVAEAMHLDNLAGTAWAVGDYASAIERYTEALAIRRRSGDERGVAISTGNIGGAHRLLGDLDGALVCYRAALGIDRRIGRPRGEAFDMHGLGQVHLDRGELDTAAMYLRKAVALRDELGETHHANESRTVLASVLDAAGQQAEAVSLIEIALASETAPPFAHAIEPVAATLRAVAVLADSHPERAERLRVDARAWLEASAARIGDPEQRQRYLTEVAAHRQLLVLGSLTGTPGR